MASRSSRRKSGLSIAAEHAAVLLEDGRKVDAPSEALLEAAQELQCLELIEFDDREYVVCAEHRDFGDIRYSNRVCNGRIYLRQGYDEDADDYRCPKCERVVYPHAAGKHRNRELRVRIIQDGVLAWLKERLAEVDASASDLGQGAFQLPSLGETGVYVYVVDLDGPENHRFNDRDRAATEPTCFVSINPRAFEGRFVGEDWLVRASLADLVSGQVSLADVLNGLAAAPTPRTLTKATIPVYAKGHVPILPVEKPHHDRLFILQIEEKTVRINGEVIVHPQAKQRRALIGILCRRFLEDVAEDIPPDEFRPANTKELLSLMEEETGDRYDDEGSLRKLINNTQADLEKAVKRTLGLPIGREDIIQTCRWKGIEGGDYGYRLNAATVAIRPPEPAQS